MSTFERIVIKGGGGGGGGDGFDTSSLTDMTEQMQAWASNPQGIDSLQNHLGFSQLVGRVATKADYTVTPPDTEYVENVRMPLPAVVFGMLGNDLNKRLRGPDRGAPLLSAPRVTYDDGNSVYTSWLPVHNAHDVSGTVYLTGNNYIDYGDGLLRFTGGGTVILGDLLRDDGSGIGVLAQPGAYVDIYRATAESVTIVAEGSTDATLVMPDGASPSIAHQFGMVRATLIDATLGAAVWLLHGDLVGLSTGGGGGTAGALLAANNLSDLANVATARANLELGTAAIADASAFAPAGAGGGTAATTTNTPAGNIAATDVQAALNELDAEKIKKTGDTGLTGSFQWRSGAVADEMLNVGVTGDTNPRLRIQANGQIEWGAGNTVFDAYIYRSGTASLTANRHWNVMGNLQVGGSGGAPTTENGVSIIGYNPSRWSIANVTGGGAKVVFASTTSPCGAADFGIPNIDTKTFNVTDWFNLRSRASAKTAGTGVITNSYGLYVEPSPIATNVYGAAVVTATTQTLWIGNDANNTTANAGIAFGSARDTNLYRSAASTLKTDGGLVVGAGLSVGGQIGFFGATPASKAAGWATPTGTLARTAFSSDTASLNDVAQHLAAVITDLRLYGLI